MTKNIGLLLVGAVSLFVLQACIVVGSVDCTQNPTDPSCTNNGGSAGKGGEGNTGNNGGAGGAAGAAGMGGTGGVGGAKCEDTCIAAVSADVPTCAGSTGEASYVALAECTCKTGGADGCADVCGDNRCMGMTSSADCDKCIQTGACMDELATCTSN